MTPLLTPEQAAKELGIGVDTLSAMRKAGDIPYVNIGRGKKRETPRYELDDLIAWKAKRKQTACQFSSAKPPRTGRTTTTSSSKVTDFREILARRESERRKRLKEASGKRPAAPGNPERP
jgi:excisionase family DNA binding protein